MTPVVAHLPPSQPDPLLELFGSVPSVLLSFITRRGAICLSNTGTMVGLNLGSGLERTAAPEFAIQIYLCALLYQSDLEVSRLLIPISICPELLPTPAPDLPLPATMLGMPRATH